MKTKYALLLFTAILFTAILTEAKSDQINTVGREFWLGFMENSESEQTAVLTVHISSNTNTTGYLEIPRQNYKRNFSVQANTTISIAIPNSMAMATRSETAEPKAIHVVAQNLVTVYALNYAERTSDAAIILPVQSLGKEYYVQSYSIKYESLFMIVPINDSTKVEITPSQRTEGGLPAGKRDTVVLNRGQVYQVKSLDGGDLTGSHIRVLSDDSVAVFGGANCTFVGNCGYACNHLFDQMVAVRDYGLKSFVTVPYMTRFDGDYFRIMAYFDSTSVSINGVFKTKLNAGKYYDLLIEDPSWISSDKPISVGQYSRSYECDNTDADPFLVNLNSSEMALDKITFNCFPSDIIEHYYVNIITPTESVNLVNFDGNNIARQFKVVPSKPAFSYAQLTISSGDHTLSSGGGAIAYVYAYGYRESYGYSAGFNVFGNFTLKDCEEDYYNPGDTIVYPISVEKMPSVQTAGVHRFSATLRFNPNVLRPVLDSTMSYKNDGILSINGEVEDLITPSILKETKFIVMLGDSECTTIELDTLGWDDYIFDAKSRCRICVHLCEADGKRLVLSTDTLALSQIMPNPVVSEARLNYVLIEQGQTDLYITDVLGNITEILYSGIAKAGVYTAAVRARDLPSGVYYCVLKTPSGVVVRKMNVCR